MPRDVAVLAPAQASPGKSSAAVKLKAQFLRFVLVGLASTLTTYAVLIVGVEAFRMHSVVASVIGYAAGAAVNYVLNYRYTFASQKQHRAAVPRFLAVMAIGMLVNGGIMYAGVEWLGLHYLLAQLAAVAVVLVWSFSANRLWAFAEKQAH